MSKYSRVIRFASIAVSYFTLSSLAFALFSLELMGVSAQNRTTSRMASPLAVGTCDLTSAALPLEVEASAGVTGPVAYSNLQAAFAAINAGTHNGVINIEVCFNSAEPAGSAVLNSGAGAAPASYTSVSIRPLADGVTISGDSGTGRGLIELNGADSVTIDGDNPNTAGTNRNLRLQNTAVATTTNTAVVRIAMNTTTVNTANDNTFKNLDILGSAVGQGALTATSSAANNTYGIFASGAASGATTPPSGFNSSTNIGNGASAANLTAQNNTITSVARGAAMHGNGSNADVFNGLLIENNTIGNPTAGGLTPDGVYAVGIVINGFTSATVRGNTIYVESFVGTSLRGIDVNGININFGSGAIVEKNRVLRVHSRQGNNSAYGISLTGGTSHTARNNFVANINSFFASSVISPTAGTHGIRVGTGSSSHQILNNSVNLYGAVLGSTFLSMSSALTVASGTPSLNIRNNILMNTMTGAPAGSPIVSIYLPSGQGTGFDLTINNNDYFSNDLLAQVGTAALSTYTVAAFDPSTTAGANNLRNYTSTLLAANTNNDNASIKADPLFTAATDPAIGPSSPAADAGTTIGSVVDDIDGQTRPIAAAYDIGADERLIASAAGAMVSGRVITAGGNGLRGALVNLTDGQGVYRTVITSSFGYYRFEDVPTGASCIVTVASKRFQFSPQVITVNGDLTEVDFIAN